MNPTFLRVAMPALLLAGLPAAAATLYVDVSSTNPVPPYTNWATAANVIQDAVDAAGTNDTVLVTNGVYDSSGKPVFGTLTNRVAVVKPLTLLSVNGPEFTIIRGRSAPGTTNGNQAIRCVYLADGAVLSGFTLTNGATRSAGDIEERMGGGLWCPSVSATVSNCLLTKNSASLEGGGARRGTLIDSVLVGNSAYEGGGAARSVLDRCSVLENIAWPGAGGGVRSGTLKHCILSGNAAPAGNGGGSYYSKHTNCLIINNSALWGGGVGGDEIQPDVVNCTLLGNVASEEGGGAFSAVLRNCIAFYNTAPVGPNYSIGLDGMVYHSCTTPLLLGPGSLGNITNAPQFVDTNGWADLRLQSNSPCINTGNNAYVTSTNDLDGNPRIVGGTVDMGAYEFQSPQSAISYAWLQHYGLPTDGSVDDQDGDNDMATTWQEWKAWTDPTNTLSVLRMLNPETGTNGTLVSWQSMPGHSYQLDRAIGAGAPFSALRSNVVGQVGTTSVMDTNAIGAGPFFYRVGVGVPAE